MSSTNHSFSAVLLGDLNDFIAPSQACVNPIFVGANSQDDKKNAKIQLSFEGDPVYGNSSVQASAKLIKKDKSTNAATVSLSDCLACSGCVTSAETVLLQQQSTSQFLSTMQQIRGKTHPTFRKSAVTISPQVRSSLAVKFGVSSLQMYAKIVQFLKSYCGVDYVLDAGALPSDAAQIECAKEFVARYRKERAQSLPLLSSTCPGWVCYAEKTHPHSVPHLSQVKSPQQVAGMLVKQAIQQELQLSSSQVYHVSVMQCPDKKLEGARKESFAIENDADSAEVNCVLTATELCETILHFFPDVPLEEIFRTRLNADEHALASLSNSLETWFGAGVTGEAPSAGGSGSLCAFVFRYSARELFQVNIPPHAALPFRQGRNSDMWFLDLQVNGETVLRFATCYGFRNIQDVVRKVKNGKCQWNFVEVMACPSGCPNGGGLLPPSGDKPTAADKKLLAEHVTQSMQTVPYRPPEENPTALSVSTGALNPRLYTSFNALESKLGEPNGLLEQW